MSVSHLLNAKNVEIESCDVGPLIESYYDVTVAVLISTLLLEVSLNLHHRVRATLGHIKYQGRLTLMRG